MKQIMADRKQSEKQGTAPLAAVFVDVITEIVAWWSELDFDSTTICMVLQGAEVVHGQRFKQAGTRIATPVGIQR